MSVDKCMYTDYKILKFWKNVRFYVVSPANMSKNRIFVVQKAIDGLKVAPVFTNTKITMFNLNSSVSPFLWRTPWLNEM